MTSTIINVFKKSKRYLAAGIVSMVLLLATVPMFPAHAASTYNCGAYGASNYSTNCLDNGSSSDDSNDGWLSGTGQAQLLYALIALAGIGLVIVPLLMRRKKHSK